MSAELAFYDEAVGLARTERFRLQLATERITARELIERRVRAEVEQYNRERGEHYAGLVQPAESERVLNGYRMTERRAIDADAQCRRALDAFERNGFLLLVDDRQVESLDELIVLRGRNEVTFVKLVPLVGG